MSRPSLIILTKRIWLRTTQNETCDRTSLDPVVGRSRSSTRKRDVVDQCACRAEIMKAGRGRSSVASAVSAENVWGSVQLFVQSLGFRPREDLLKPQIVPQRIPLPALPPI